MTTTFYDHWREVTEGAWRWKNFSPAEIACRGTGKLLVHEAALDHLQTLREKLGKPFIVRSAYRSPEHNRAARSTRSTWRASPSTSPCRTTIRQPSRRRRARRDFSVSASKP